jgi:hypothetical protein
MSLQEMLAHKKAVQRMGKKSKVGLAAACRTLDQEARKTLH